MDLQDAIEQYADMLALGTQAMRRLAKQELDGERLSRLLELTDEIVERAERLKIESRAKRKG